MRRHKGRKIIIGVTGSFGSGKTSVARLMRSYGAQVLDADAIAHDCYRPQGRAYKKIVKAFGGGMLDKTGAIDRPRLGKLVFGDKELLKKLNAIIHPQVEEFIKKRTGQCGSGVIVIDAPLLIESGLHRIADRLVVVKVNRQQQLKRVKARDGLGAAEALRRINNQLPLRYKVRLADFIIDNSGTRKETREQVKKIWRKLWKN